MVSSEVNLSHVADWFQPYTKREATYFYGASLSFERILN